MVLHLHHLIKKWAGGRKKSQGDIREVPFFPQSGEGRAEIEAKVWPVERKLLGSFHGMQQFKTHWLQAGKAPIILGKSESDFLKSQGTYMSAESELIFELKLWCMAVNHLDRTDRPPPTVLHNQRSRRGDQCFMITEQKGKYQTFLKISHPIYIWSLWNKGLPSHPSIKHQDQNCKLACNLRINKKLIFSPNFWKKTKFGTVLIKINFQFLDYMEGNLKCNSRTL